MPLELLIQAGLTPTQAELLGFLLSQGTLKAKEIVSALSKPRGVVYKSLEELIELKLVEKIEKLGTVATFRAQHPSHLEALFEAKEKQAQNDREAFLHNLPEITAHYNLSQRKPEIKHFEGEAGLQRLINDALQGKTELLSFLDKGLVDAQLNYSDYWEQARRQGIKQRILITGEKPANSPNPNTDDGQLEIRYLGTGPIPFKSAAMIYDSKLAFVTSTGNQRIATVIEDKDIYEMNKAWFEFLWHTAQ